MIIKTLEENREKVVDVAILIKVILMVATTISKAIIITEVILMAVDVVVVEIKELPITTLHKITIPVIIIKGMKLVGPKTMTLPVLDVEAQTTGQSLVVHHHIYVNYTKPLSKERRRK